MNRYLFGLVAAVAGFALSTGIALSNGYTPDNIYFGTRPDIVAENERLLKEARQIRAVLTAANRDQQALIDELQSSLGTMAELNGAMLGSFDTIGRIVREGEDDGKKLQEIAAALDHIGDVLISLADGS